MVIEDLLHFDKQYDIIVKEEIKYGREKNCGD